MRKKHFPFLLCFTLLAVLPIRIQSDPGMVEDSIIAFDNRIKANPADFDAYLSLGKIYRETRVFSEAGRFLLKAKNLRPADVNVTFLLGENAMDVKKVSVAIKYYDECLRLDSSFVPALSSLAEIAIMARHDSVTALKYYEKILTIDSTHTKALQNLAILLQ